jgi:hypothetical protein
MRKRVTKGPCKAFDSLVFLVASSMRLQWNNCVFRNVALPATRVADISLRSVSSGVRPVWSLGQISWESSTACVLGSWARVMA